MLTSTLRNDAELTVYKASAGSGKTFTLSVEYIKLLIINPYSYRNILAVTFTNKATEEMKQRILSELYGIWKQLPSSQSYMDAIALTINRSHDTIRENAGIALKNLIHNYSYFHVETIDTFFQSVLRNLARELDLTANLRIWLNDTQVEEQAVDELIESLDYKSSILKWIMNYISNNISEDKSWNVIGQIKSFGKTIFRDYYKENSKELNKKLSEKGFWDNYKSEIQIIKQKSKSDMKTIADKFFKSMEEKGLDVTSFKGKEKGITSYFRKLQSDDFSDKNCLNKTVIACLDNAEEWVTKNNPDYTKIISVINESLMDILQEAERARHKNWIFFLSADVTLRHLDQLRLLSAIESKVRNMNNESNRFLLSDTQQLLHSLVEGSDSPFIFEKIGTRLEHIMIDEFQDTSTVQWKNFLVLLEECMSHATDESDSNLSNNLIVGDVKQSIYRWRSGDWRLLNDIKSQFKSINTIDIRNLQTNYRSARKIISFNNAFFTTASDIEFANESEIDKIKAQQMRNAYMDVCQKIPETRQDNGYIKISLLPNKEDYEENVLRQTLDDVTFMLHTGIKPEKIAILVRSNKYISKIADYFMENIPEIKIVSDEAFKLGASIAVTTIVQALHLLTHPNDIIAKSNLAKVYQNLIQPSTSASINSMQNIDNLLPNEYIKNFDKLTTMPLFDLAEKIYKIFSLNNISGQDAYVCAFFDCLNDFVQDSSASIDEFVQQWNDDIHEKTIQCDEVNGIRLLSIHKSKGLEYDNVIIPFCDWAIEINNSTLWCNPTIAPFNELPIVPIDYSGKLNDTIYAAEYQDEHLQNSVDNLNLLYVAFTRARNNLFAIGKKDARNSRSVLIQQCMDKIHNQLSGSVLTGLDAKDKMTPIEFEFGTLEPSSQKNETNTDNIFLTNPISERLQITTYESPISYKQSNKSREFINGDDDDKKQNEYIKRGNILHKIFSSIKTTNDIDHVLREMEFEGILYDEKLTFKDLKLMLESSLSNPTIANWFSDRWTIFNECNIIDVDDTTGKAVEHRPDRVMTDGNEMIVVDYKFGKPKESYYKQVLMYMSLLDRMGYKNIKGYLWFVYNNQIEEVKK
jgi:ATP-dependent exoDNAse (exonuclease V) beta subunit